MPLVPGKVPVIYFPKAVESSQLGGRVGGAIDFEQMDPAAVLVDPVEIRGPFYSVTLRLPGGTRMTEVFLREEQAFRHEAMDPERAAFVTRVFKQRTVRARLKEQLSASERDGLVAALEPYLPAKTKSPRSSR